MTLADYLENKAEYIFDKHYIEYSKGSYQHIPPKELQDNKEIIIDRLKRGLRELAKIHDEKFFENDITEKNIKYKKNLFDGWVKAYWDKKHGRIKGYIVSLTFLHWSFAKTMIEKTNKKFEDIFNVNVTVVTERDIRREENATAFNAYGSFLDIGYPTYFPAYFPANFLFLDPLIAELNKHNAFTIFNITDTQELFTYYKDILEEYDDQNLKTFGDFIALTTSGEGLKHVSTIAKYLLVAKIPDGSVGAIKLEEEEYRGILKVTEHIKNTKQIPTTNIFLKDVLSMYIYSILKGNNP